MRQQNPLIHFSLLCSISAHMLISLGFFLHSSFIVCLSFQSLLLSSCCVTIYFLLDPYFLISGKLTSYTIALSLCWFLSISQRSQETHWWYSGPNWILIHWDFFFNFLATFFLQWDCTLYTYQLLKFGTTRSNNTPRSLLCHPIQAPILLTWRDGNNLSLLFLSLLHCFSNPFGTRPLFRQKEREKGTAED